MPFGIVTCTFSDNLSRNSCIHNRAFSHDVTAAILVFQNNETAAMLVSQTNPVGVEPAGLFRGWRVAGDG